MGSIEPIIQTAPFTTPIGSLFSLAGRTIAVTGGGRGLGITLAAAVLDSGGHAACIDILPLPSEPEWTCLQALAKASNLTLSYHRCDITVEDAVSATLDQIADTGSKLGAPLHGTIACAGIQQMAPAVNYPTDGFRRMMDVNVTGTFLTIKHSARIFMAQGIKGSVVMIASMSGQIANRGLACTAYNTSKAAVQQMCRSVAQEWGAHGIRVNTLSPGVCLPHPFLGYLC